MNNNRWLQALIVLLVIIAAAWLAGQTWLLIIHFANILLLFFLAWLLAFALSPLARWLQRHGLPELVSVILVYLGLLLAVFLVGTRVFPALADQIQTLIAAMPGYTDELTLLGERSLDQLTKWGIRLEDLHLDTLYGTFGAQVQNVGGSVLSFISGLTSFLFNAIIILLLSFYFTKDGARMFSNMIALLPRSLAAEVQLLGDSITRAFGAFLRGQVLFALIYGVLNAAIMTVFHEDYVLIASIVAGAAMVIPLVGNFLAYVPPVLIMLVGYDAERWWILLLVLLVMQGIMMQVVGPRIMSHAVGLHPLFVVFALLAGLQIAGPWGALFSIPVAGVLNQVAGPYYGRLREFFNPPNPTEPALALQGAIPVAAVTLPAPESPAPAPPAAALGPTPAAVAVQPGNVLVLLRGISRRVSSVRRRARS